jgi:hypothetical protein
MVGCHIRRLLTEAQHPRLVLGIVAGVVFSLAFNFVGFGPSMLWETMSFETMRATKAAILATASILCGVAASLWLLGPGTRFERLVGWTFAVTASFGILYAFLTWGRGLDENKAFVFTLTVWILAAVSGWVSTLLTFSISGWILWVKRRQGVWVALLIFLLALALAPSAVGITGYALAGVFDWY